MAAETNFSSRILGLQRNLPGTLCDRVGRNIGRATTILDAGCGTGLFAQSLVDSTYLRNKTIIGLDAHIPSIRLAKRRRVYDDIVRGDVTHLPFRDKALNLVMCIEVIEHLPREKGFELLYEAERVASSDILLTTPNGFVPQHAQSHCELKDFNPLSVHLSGWLPQDFENMKYHVKGNGLRVIWGGQGLIRRAPARLNPLITAISYAMNPITSRVPGIAAGLICWKTFGEK